MATMKIMDAVKGHATLTYDPQVEDEVAPVRDRFNELVGGGFVAFVIDNPQTKRGHQIDSFPVAADEIILTHPIAGG